MNKPKLFEIIFESLAFHPPFDCLLFKYFKLFRSFEPHAFVFQGETYEYFYHKYNHTWRNERAVEIPIVKRILDQYRGKNILEVGNVFSHYFPICHDVLDKYEKGESVINQDAAEFSSLKKYDLVVSVSTIEHIGDDENPKQPQKSLAALENLKTLVSPQGKIVITFPLGYNQELDKMFRQECLGLTKSFCLKRVSPFNKWQEVECQDASLVKYNQPYRAGNAIVLGIIG
ncbi:class I SAM-dependent methyltransferase [Patescibacteria group bacterium]|nr:class I SAM-dependent methyltransferase [Patescibacteria group bacterium]